MRCKTLKVRCTEAAQGCQRCARAGKPCIPAPPSRQGKRTRQEYDLDELMAKLVSQQASGVDDDEKPTSDAAILVTALAHTSQAPDGC